MYNNKMLRCPFKPEVIKREYKDTHLINRTETVVSFRSCYNEECPFYTGNITGWCARRK